MPWKSSGRISGPAAGAVLVDTGPLPGQSRCAQVVVACSTALVAEFQWRNADNTATIQSQIVAVPANGTAVLPCGQVGTEWDMQDNERLRVVAVSASTGNASASLFHSA